MGGLFRIRIFGAAVFFPGVTLNLNLLLLLLARMHSNLMLDSESMLMMEEERRMIFGMILLFGVFARLWLMEVDGGS